MHLAAANGKMQICKLLIEKGAKIISDRFGGLPLHDALRNNHLDVADLFDSLSVEADVNFEEDPFISQKKKVFELIVKEGNFSFSIIANEVEFF